MCLQARCVGEHTFMSTDIILIQFKLLSKFKNATVVYVFFIESNVPAKKLGRDVILYDVKKQWG